MRILKYLNIFVGTLALLGYAARPARAQFTGYNSPQTVQQALTTNTTCTGSAQDFPVQNLGRTQHWATGTVSAGMNTFQMQFFGFDASGNATAISDPMTLMNSPQISNGILTATGYFPVVKVRVFCLPNTATFTVNYSGSSSSPIPITGGYQVGAIDKVLAVSQDATVNPTFFSLNAPYGSSGGTLIFNYSVSSMTGSTLQVQCGTTNSTAGFIPNITITLANTLVAQTFQMPSQPCPFPKVAYTHGTNVGGTLFNLEYIFAAPAAQPSSSSTTLLNNGNNEGIPLFEKGARWSAVSNPAVSTQASASRAAGAAGVRHVADCISVTAGASTAPTATSLVINLRDGASGAGTVLWSVDVNAAATAANHGAYNFCGLNLIGSAATAMTLEFAALLTNEFESVTLTGYDVQ